MSVEGPNLQPSTHGDRGALASDAARSHAPKRAKVEASPSAVPSVNRRILQCQDWDTDGSFGTAFADVVTAAGPAAPAVLFERPLSRELRADAQQFADATDSSDFGPLLEQYVSLPQTDAELNTMATELVAAALPRGQLAETVARDTAGMAVALNRLVGGIRGATLKVALEIVGQNRCRRWHMDNYIGRFVATYGEQPGTVFIDDDAVDFEQLRTSWSSNDLVVPDASGAVTARPGTLALIKGRQWPDTGGVVHRSPDIPIGEDGILPHRLMVKVDVKLGPHN